MQAKVLVCLVVDAGIKIKADVQKAALVTVVEAVVVKVPAGKVENVENVAKRYRVSKQGMTEEGMGEPEKA